MEPWLKAKCERTYDWDFDCRQELEPVVKLVVDRSKGQLRQLRMMFCSSESVQYIAYNCPLLTNLSIAESFYLEDESALLLAESCRHLESLNLSDCYLLKPRSFEIFGRNCCTLISFSRNMLRTHEFFGLDLPDGDQDAMAIGSYIQGLKNLELKKTISMTDYGLMHIASGCRDLESLNLAIHKAHPFDPSCTFEMWLSSSYRLANWAFGLSPALPRSSTEFHNVEDCIHINELGIESEEANAQTQDPQDESGKIVIFLMSPLAKDLRRWRDLRQNEEGHFMKRPMALAEVIEELKHPDLRENALRCLSGHLIEVNSELLHDG
ncbi:hypothetical protein R1sor_017496 [Riccia sorocarpa]|uniref:Uncharacterized protein n=1 Tax=Riccia sorocarpa TaxID=122646 RepID=A0ABD3I8T4_9MARC